jgi:hypothetical protein
MGSKCSSSSSHDPPSRMNSLQGAIQGLLSGCSGADWARLDRDKPSYNFSIFSVMKARGESRRGGSLEHISSTTRVVSA